MSDAPTSRSGIDWEGAREHLAAVARAAAGELTPEQVAGRLRARAREAALPVPEPPSPGTARDHVVFTVAGERYAIAAGSVREVLALRSVTPLPGVSGPVASLTHHRGRLIPLLDMGRLLELPPSGEPLLAVALEAGGFEIGILADAVEGFTSLRAEEVRPEPAGGAPRPSFVAGVTADAVTVLDPEALASDPRLVVREEVS